ncbi:MAG TPA: hypothetical protein VIY10_00305 [Solirubrobacteraceae bacterium]|jgi:hypothetical protein
MLPRIALAGLAAVAAVWFAVLLVDTHKVNQAAAAAGSIAAVRAALTGPQAQFDRRIDDLRSARFVNPDASISLDIAGAFEVRGGAANLNRAQSTVSAVLRSEPQNLDAWAALYRIQGARNDAAAQAQALAHAQRLDPLDFRSR